MARRNTKKVRRHKSRKIWAKKKFFEGIDEKYVDQNKLANSNIQNRKDIGAYHKI